MWLMLAAILGVTPVCENGVLYEYESPTHVKTKILKVCDMQMGYVCYVVPNQYCAGECAYSPAIACLKLPDTTTQK